MSILSDLQTRLIDFIGIGDSNQVYSAHGWDHGWQYALDQVAPMYGTGLVTYAENNFNGSGLGWNYAKTDNNIGTGSDPHSSVFVRNSGSGLSPHLPMYLDTGTLNGSGANGVIINSATNLDLTAELYYDLDHATFDGGGGSLRFGGRREESPYTALPTADAISTDGRNLWRTTRHTIAADTGRSEWGSITARFAAFGISIDAPIATLYQTVINSSRTNGWRFTNGLYRGGEGLRTFAGDCTGLSDNTWAYFFNRIRARQLELGQRPRVVIVINSGLNDRGDSTNSVGPSPAPSNTAAGFKDNLNAIRNRIRSVYPGSVDELTFLSVPSHPVSNPDDSRLIDFRTASAEWASEYDDTAWLDISAGYTSTQILANGWYQSGGSDTSHLTQSAYESIGSTLKNGLAGVSASQVLSRGVVDYAGGFWTDFGTDNPIIPATGDCKLSAKIRLDSVGAEQTIYSQFLATSNNGRLAFRINTSGQLELFVGNQGTHSSLVVTGSDALSANTDYTVAFERSGSSWFISIDGSTVETGSDADATRQVLQGGCLLGAKTQNATNYLAALHTFMGGLIWDVRVEHQGEEVYFWPLDEGSGNHFDVHAAGPVGTPGGSIPPGDYYSSITQEAESPELQYDEVEIALPRRLARRVEKDGNVAETAGDQLSGSAMGVINARKLRISERI